MHELEQDKKWGIIIAIMLSLLFAALNQSIVSMALPQIMADIGQREDISWIFTSYILAASIPALLVGKLSDLYGRKPFIMLGLSLFITGSLLAGVAESFFELVVFRAIQGLGGGAIIVTAFSTIGDLYSPRERGRWQSILGGVFALASLLAPALGGYIVDHGHWKWVFWISTPLGCVALIMIGMLLPSYNNDEKQRVDYLGAALLVATLLPLLLVLNKGWNSSGLLLICLIALVAFIKVERRVPHPIVPWSLFGNNVFTLSNLIVFIMGASIFSALMYLPLFLQGVMGISATVSGSMMMIMTLSLVISSYYSSHRISHTGRYKGLAFTGLSLIAIGMFLFSLLHSDSSYTQSLVYITIIGMGSGIAMPVFNLSQQNAVEHDQLGVAIAAGQLSRQLGSMIGIAYMGALISHDMYVGLGNQLTPHVLMQASREALNSGLTDVFFTASITLLLAMSMVFFLKEIPLRSTK